MPISLFVVGDSISIHYGPWLRRYVNGIFDYDRKGGPEVGEDLGPAPDPANGRDSVHVLSYLEELREAGFSTRVLLLNCGLHDIRQEGEGAPCQVSLAGYVANLERIIALGRELARELVWVRTTPVRQDYAHRLNGNVDAYNAAADRCMTQNGVPSIDLHRLSLSFGREVFTDDAHFQLEARKIQGAYIAGWLVRFAGEKFPSETADGRFSEGSLVNH